MRARNVPATSIFCARSQPLLTLLSAARRTFIGMEHTLSRREQQEIHHVREWRSVDVHQPSASSLMSLSGALLLTGLALGLLALIAIMALPFLAAGALAWTAGSWLLRRMSFVRRRVPIGRLRPFSSGAPPVRQASAPGAPT